MRYIDHTGPARTHDDVLRSIHEANELNRFRTNLVDVHGFFGSTVLSTLRCFDLVNSISLDYMHTVLEGIVKFILLQLFDRSGHPAYIRSALPTVDARLTSIRPPHFFTRLPRRLSDSLHHFKASELQIFLLFYAYPCLAGIVPQQFLEHLMLLSSAIFLLLKDTISQADISRAATRLEQFVNQAVQLYGLEAASSNLHSLLHMAQSVRHLGPLSSSACFAYEDCIRKLLGMVNAGNSPTLQIAERYVFLMQVRSFFQRSEVTNGVLHAVRKLSKNSHLSYLDYTISKDTEPSARTSVFCDHFKEDVTFELCNFFGEAVEIDSCFHRLALGAIYFILAVIHALPNPTLRFFLQQQDAIIE